MLLRSNTNLQRNRLPTNCCKSPRHSSIHRTARDPTSLLQLLTPAPVEDQPALSPATPNERSCQLPQNHHSLHQFSAFLQPTEQLLPMPFPRPRSFRSQPAVPML
ncbi:hypothetical protein KC19_VG227800 [Ceratodon purpureus]|uniref:Uncharacterized protein n=1 Tax=Ceratodon purpureus TaxID=3225 RepID=A0A8T0HSQ7_CERPU|nr:hypothetical protein KC19_VG227800 [Ceratodon purpureus]